MTRPFIQNTSDIASWIGEQYPEIRGAKATSIVRTIFGMITKSLFEQQQAGLDSPHVQIHGFGSIRLLKMKARTARNPRTGEPVSVGERLKLKWNASNTLKDAFNSGDKDYFEKFTSYNPESGAGNDTDTETTEGDVFAGRKNRSSASGAGHVMPVQEEVGVGGASENMPRRRGRRPRINSLPPSMEQPVRRPRGRPKKMVDSTLGGASTNTTPKRSRKRTTTTSTNSTTPTQQATTGRTKTGSKPIARKNAPLTDVKLRRAVEQFLSTIVSD